MVDGVGILLLVLLVTNVASAFFTAFVATAKGYSTWSWLVAGLVFGVIALIAAAGLPIHPKLRRGARGS